MNSRKNLKFPLWTMVLLMPALLVSGAIKNDKNKETANMNRSGTNSIQQKKKNLIEGVVEAVCYSGFRTGQHPDRGDGAKNPSAKEVLEDLQIIQNEMGFKLIRLYDSGRNSEMVLQLIREYRLDIKVMLGIWLNAELSAHETCEWLTEPIPQKALDANKIANLAELQRGINLANKYPETVCAVSVGNESLIEWNDHRMHVDTVIAYCRRVKDAVEQPVTVADNYEWWAAHGQKLSKVLDFVSVHIYPVWEGFDIDQGLSYSIDNIQKVRNALPDAKIVISEAGWASVASEFGQRASEKNQQRYYNEFMQWAKGMNITTFFFEAFDEDWKGDPKDPWGAEKHWGLYTVDRKPKLVMKEGGKS
ncbi:glycosyl hydrolase [Mariniphaga sediminis]|uniref:Endo-1,3-beta-glucanase btgC n=1 Tax=Mariniphaga sediminis TaxID=1628158 RepID=A0A399CY27_9BACT|nr:glycosyl hydrolase family 17 protein [Mariniphaga sediminis]RIH63301.1 glycosyl hydrolase [Mariniphaga sediminis]